LLRKAGRYGPAFFFFDPSIIVACASKRIAAIMPNDIATRHLALALRTNKKNPTVMKTLVFLSAILLLTACDVYYVDPVVPAPPPYDLRDMYIGTYDISEYSSTYDEYWDYRISIYKSSGDVVIDNFYNSGLNVYATVTPDGIYIPWQTVNGYELQGDGYIDGSKLVINYKVRDSYTEGSAWDFCGATGWR